MNFLQVSLIIAIFFSCGKIEEESSSRFGDDKYAVVSRYCESFIYGNIDSSFSIVVKRFTIAPYMSNFDSIQNSNNKLGYVTTAKEKYNFLHIIYLDALKEFAYNELKFSKSRINNCIFSSSLEFSISGCTEEEYIRIYSHKSIVGIRPNGKIEFSPITVDSNFVHKRIHINEEGKAVFIE